MEKSIRCRLCRSTSVTVNIAVNPNSIESIHNFCQTAGPIVHTGWCSECSKNVGLETMDEDCLLMLCECDTWLSKDSKRIIGVFSDMFRLEEYLRNMLRGGIIEEADIVQLRQHNQTQGREVNYLIETKELNPEYCE